MKYIFIFFCFFLVFSFVSMAQYTTSDKEAIKLYERAERALKAESYYAVKVDAQNAIKLDSMFVEAYMILGQVFAQERNFDEALRIYERATRLNGDAYPKSYLLLGSIQYFVGKLEDAAKSYMYYLSFENEKKETREIAEYELQKCEFRINAKKNPVPFVPKNLGPDINSEFDEYLPALTADEQTLVITVRLPRENVPPNSKNKFNEDFFISQKIDGVWQKRQPIGNEINTPNNEGAQSISADGQLLFFTACEKSGGYGGCDIYCSRKIGDKWGKPVNLGQPVNTDYWESQPSISSDGKTLYFASDRFGGYGELDIWKTTLDSNGKWTKPVNLGKSINTSASEMSPFIHPDNTTLYFASDGWIGMGGLDLFMSRCDEKDEWSEPKNLGYPINTSGEETSLIVNAIGNKAYFSSRRDDTFGGMDLYEFELYQEVRPIPVTYVKGKVFDATTKNSLEAKFELVDIETAELIVEATSNSGNGEFLVSIPVNRNYALSVSKKGYLFYSENFSLKDVKDASEPFKIDIPLSSIKIGQKIVLKNIFFETNSFVLKTESKVELNKLVNFMTENSNIKIEISGHTDNVGRKDLNMKLSEKRAKAVYDYLLQSKAISEFRLKFKGYADTQPIESNATPEGKAKNRRTEIKIIE